MKKILAMVGILLCFALVLVSFTPIYAAEDSTETEKEEVQETESGTDFYKIKEEAGGKLEQYSEKYGSKAYGITAMILDTVRIYSIPFCLLGIAIGSMYQYIIGIRRLDIRDRGFNLIIAFVTILVIAQVLPLIFAIVVKGWVL